MKLIWKEIEKDRGDWTRKGYSLPSYDRAAMIEKTAAAPAWVHFGAGNIFRAFHADIAEQMLESGEADRGLIAIEGFDYEIISSMFRPHDNLSLAVTLKADGKLEKKVLGSIAESCILDSADTAEYAHLKEIFESPSLQMATFTITEKGYATAGPDGGLLPAIASDFAAGPEGASSYLGKVVSLLYARYRAGALPLAMVSTDNCSHNGDKLFAAVDAFARAWTEKGLAEPGFLTYVEDSGCVSFPWTMIDKITPRPDDSVRELLQKDGVEDLSNIETGKHTFVAPFVNAEETGYLVIEDSFPNGRPALEKAGVIFTDRETVDRVETMKVTTCLNPLHTALAVFGCLLGYTKISEEMKDPDLSALVHRIGYTEGLPVVTDPVIIRPRDFIDTVVNVRIPNPFMPDTPQRIATDTSQKLPVRYGQTIKKYMERGLDMDILQAIPLVFAGWLRYVMAADDEGEAFVPSPDPLLAEMEEKLSAIRLGEQDEEKVREVLLPILQNESIFGTDLVKAGLSDRVISDFMKLIAGHGAVRKTLHEVTEEWKA